MASPLSLVRKHQKKLLVVFGVTLMVLFLVGTFLPTTPSMSGGAIENPVVVTWDGGRLLRSDLDMMRFRHFQMLRFLGALEQRAMESRADARQTAYLQIIPLATSDSGMDREQMDYEIFRRYFFAQLAEEEGVTISDTYLDGYLSLIAGGMNLTRADIDSLNRSVNRGELGVQALRRHLKMELAAQLYTYMLGAGTVHLESPIALLTNNPFAMGSSSPLETAQRYAQATRRIDCEVIPVRVRDYLDSVSSQPTDAELRELFRQGQYQLPDPTGLKPGFKLPQRFALQYFRGSVDEFLVNEMNKLTDKEVQEEYDRRVQANDPLVYEDLFGFELPGVDDPALESGGGTLPGEGSGDTGQGDATEKKDDQSESQDEQQTEQKQEEQNEAQGDGDGGGMILANRRGGNAESAIDRQDEGQQDSGTQEGTDEAQQDQESGQTGQQTDQQTDQAQQQQDMTTDAPPVAEQEGAPGALPDDPPPARQRRVRPLAEVAERLKREMKYRDAERALESALVEAEGEVRGYDIDVRDWEYGESSKRGPKPNPPDFKAIAERLGLHYGETGVIDAMALRDLNVAEGVDRSLGPNATFLPVVMFRFSEAAIFQPFRFKESDRGRELVFWFREKHETAVRDFASAKADVQEYWRKQRATELARREAERIANEANASGKSLIELDPTHTQVTGEFSHSNVFQDFGPQHVEDPGTSFLDAAFGLSPGRATTALNQTGTIVYVIRQISDSATQVNLNDALYQVMVNSQRFPMETGLLVLQKSRETFVAAMRQQERLKNVRWNDR